MAFSGHSPGILVTRPEPQAQGTIEALNQLGWQVYHFPTIRINKTDSLATEQTRSRLKASDWLIFISQPAVQHFFSDFNAKELSYQKIAAVGKATKKALLEKNIQVDACPESATNSEALLELPVFNQIRNQNIVIVRGVGGRELLHQTLANRGANVSYLEVYERLLASPDKDLIRQHWDNDIDVVICTSNQLLENYLKLAEPLLGNKIFNKPMLVISSRMLTFAKQAGFSKIWLADGPGNDQMIKTIKTHLQLD